jgi:aldose 1-epimerase
MSETIPPSGAQIELAHGDHSAVIVEVGGALRCLRLGDWDVLDGYGIAEMAGGGRGQPLLPWPNRLRDGRYGFDGEDFQLSISEPPTGTAIHGLTRWANWTVADRGPAHVRVEHVLHAHSGYPFVLALGIEYALDDAGLRAPVPVRCRPTPISRRRYSDHRRLSTAHPGREALDPR